MEEVRYHMLRPGQVVQRRKECPVAYIPLGTIEWHGLHNPLGADALQAEGLAVLCARRGGGLAFPALYYGENRLEGIMEVTSADRARIAELMELPPENFEPHMMPSDREQQRFAYLRLLMHILGQAETLGFRLAVLLAGHYPLIDHARAAALEHNQRIRARKGMLAWAATDFLMVIDRYDCAGDHAAGWETSHLLALHPQTVDMSLLPPKGQPLVGVGGKMPPQDATAGFGQEVLEAAADAIVQEVRDRLAHPEIYYRHGQSLLEDAWKIPGSAKARYRK